MHRGHETIILAFVACLLLYSLKFSRTNFRGLPNFPRKSNFRDKIFVDKLLCTSDNF